MVATNTSPVLVAAAMASKTPASSASVNARRTPVGVGVTVSPVGGAGAAGPHRRSRVRAEPRGDRGVLAFVVDEAAATVPGEAMPGRADDVHRADLVPVALVGGDVRVHDRR